VCKYMSPYARFQSAMFDKDTLIISYDEQRGDPRGTRSRKIDARAQGLGDCIDCGLCVQVCPTGIDIRNGLQYECIGCTACIDVCNGVMEKMKYPRGLIRYTSQNGLAAGATWPELLRRTLRPRVLVYALILALIVGAWAASIATRAPLRVDVVRDRASLARLVEAGWIENVYRLQLMNLTEQPRRYTVRAEGLDGLVVTAEPGYDLEPAGARWVTIALRVPPETADSVGAGAHGVRFIVEADSVGSPGGDATAARTPRPVIESSTFIVPR
jgi:cytochrome c oxidase accessory protein FixG